VQYKHEALRDDNRTGDGQRLAVLEDATFTTWAPSSRTSGACATTSTWCWRARGQKLGAGQRGVLAAHRAGLAGHAEPEVAGGIATGFRAPEIFVEDVHVDTLGGEQVRVRNTDGLKEERALTTCSASTGVRTRPIRSGAGMPPPPRASATPSHWARSSAAMTDS
jgi:outer membrane receptor for ferrienterochelin and colicins